MKTATATVPATPNGVLTLRTADGDVTLAIEWVDPDLAKAYYARNRKNRPVRRYKSTAYARDLLDMRWHFLGDPIRFDNEGDLMDGQHRLLGIIDSDLGAHLVVIRGLAPELQDIVDSGLSRTIGDVLSLAGVASSGQVGATATKVLVFRRTGALVPRRWAPTRAEILDTAEEEAVQEAALWASRHRVSGLAPSSLGFCRWLFGTKKHADKVETFFARLISGAELGVNDPILMLREKLHNAPKGTLGTEDRVDLVIRAWNAHCEGRKFRKFPAQGFSGKLIEAR